MSDKNNLKLPGQGKVKDTAEKIFWKEPKRFAEIFNKTIFITNPVAASDLEDRDTDETALVAVTEDGKTTLQQYRDISKSLKNGQRLAILGIENQTKINYMMPFRVMEMDFISYARQVQEINDRHNENKDLKSGAEFLSDFAKADRLTPCITLVISYDTEPWDGPRKLSDMFEESEWKKYASEYNMNLIEINSFTDEELAKFSTDIHALFAFIKYSKKKKDLVSYVRKNKDVFSKVSRAAYDTIAEISHTKALLEIKKAKETETEKNEEGKEEVVDMCQAIDDLIRDSKAEGETIGEARGRVFDIIELLEDLGEVSETLKNIIKDQTDSAILSKWLKLAARSDSLEDFKKAIG